MSRFRPREVNRGQNMKAGLPCHNVVLRTLFKDNEETLKRFKYREIRSDIYLKLY